MEQTRPPTAEKQLLELIESPKPKAPVLQAQTIKHQGLSLFSAGAWSSRLSFLKNNFRQWFKSDNFYSSDAIIKTINRIFILIIAVLIIYLINSLSVAAASLKKVPDLKSDIQQEAAFANFETPSELTKVVSYYLEKVKQRDIFKMGARPSTSQAAVREPSYRVIEATKHLKLVGISWSRDPDAMIEDTKALRTFFVKRGGMVGDFKVQAIFKDKVVLSYAGEEIELR